MNCPGLNDRRVAAAAAVLVIIVHAAAAAAGPFSDLVVFGDSLSDVGNIDSATFGIYPGRYYFNDRFSNGPVYVEALAAGLGLPATVRSTAGGSNFAYGGARTAGTGGFEGNFIRDIDEQVDQFLASRVADSNALFVVFAGSNDLVGSQADVSIPVGNLVADIGRLIAAGAQHFLVPNLPLLGYTPRFNGINETLESYNERTIDFNTALDTALGNLQSGNPAVAFFRLDVAGLFSQALANPAAFGLANVTDAAAPGLQPGASSYNTSQIAQNDEEYLFWDDLHPTSTVHAHLAQAALKLLLPLPGDFNDDGTVDAADYARWRGGLGENYTEADYDIWAANFGASNSTGTQVASAAASAGIAGQTRSANLAVPEPATIVLVAAIFPLLLWRERSMQSRG